MNGAVNYAVEYVKELTAPAGSGIRCAVATSKAEANKALAECMRHWRGAGKVWEMGEANLTRVAYQGTGNCTGWRLFKPYDGVDGYSLKEMYSRKAAGYFRIINTDKL